jgi:hypothetical protein
MSRCLSIPFAFVRPRCAGTSTGRTARKPGSPAAGRATGRTEPPTAGRAELRRREKFIQRLDQLLVVELAVLVLVRLGEEFARGGE